MKLIKEPKKVIRSKDKIPTCPSCDTSLDYCSEGLFTCGLEGIYYEVEFRKAGYGYKKIGVFG